LESEQELGIKPDPVLELEPGPVLEPEPKLEPEFLKRKIEERGGGSDLELGVNWQSTTGFRPGYSELGVVSRTRT